MSNNSTEAMASLKQDVDYTFALAGNPNVGKSTLFNHLTGLSVTTANYAGKTVSLNIAKTDFRGSRIGIIDLPGTYAIGAVSEDQWVARQAILDGDPDVVIAILDATNLRRNLYMILQFLDLGFPMVVALNLVDQAERQGLDTDIELLSERLGLPIVSTVANRGQGVEKLMAKAVETATAVRERSSPVPANATGPCECGQDGCDCVGPAIQDRPDRPPYSRNIEEAIVRIEAALQDSCTDRSWPSALSGRALSILLLEEDSEFLKLVDDLPGGSEVVAVARRESSGLQAGSETASIRLTRERHAIADAIAGETQATTEREGLSWGERLWRYTTAPVSGLAMLAATLTFIFIFMFYVGTMLAENFSAAWAVTMSPVIGWFITLVAGQTLAARILSWGLDAGVEATLAVGIPYVLTFYFMLAFLEDSGYLNSVAFLTDRLMHRFGLHGRAMIPLVAGLGCNVPAIVGTRVLATERERIVASTLITLVPCSARTAVIIGSLAFVGGWQPAAAIYAIVFALIILVGIALDRMLPNQSHGLVMEMFPFRMPSLKTVVKKTWHRFKHFITAAAPIIVAGSLILGALYETDYLWKLSAPLAPVVEGWLGLPAVAGLTLLFAILRKELALQLLVTLAIVQYGAGAKNLSTFMDPNQLFVYALVSTIYIPCVSTIAILARELTWKRALLISSFTVTLAVIVGGIANQLLIIF